MCLLYLDISIVLHLRIYKQRRDNQLKNTQPNATWHNTTAWKDTRHNTTAWKDTRHNTTAWRHSVSSFIMLSLAFILLCWMPLCQLSLYWEPLFWVSLCWMLFWWGSWRLINCHHVNTIQSRNKFSAAKIRPHSLSKQNLCTKKVFQKRFLN